MWEDICDIVLFEIFFTSLYWKHNNNKTKIIVSIQIAFVCPFPKKTWWTPCSHRIKEFKDI